MGSGEVFQQIDLVSTLLTTISGLLVLLLGVFGWIGSRVHGRLDEIAHSLGSIEKDLRNDLSSLDRRLARMETASEFSNILNFKKPDNRQRSRRTDKEEGE